MLGTTMILVFGLVLLIFFGDLYDITLLVFSLMLVLFWQPV